MNNFHIEGKVKKLSGVIENKGYEKRLFAIETNENYPQMIKFEVGPKRLDQLNGIKVGDTIVVSFNIRGREYQGKVFNNLQAWKIEEPNKDEYTPSNNESLSEAPDGLPF